MLKRSPVHAMKKETGFQQERRKYVLSTWKAGNLGISEPSLKKFQNSFDVIYIKYNCAI